MVAQPPFSMTARRFHDETLLKSTNFAGASAWCWNFSTQIGASTATTAVSARWIAIRSAVLPRGPSERREPTTLNTTTPATAPHTAGFTPGWIFIFVTLAPGEANFSCFHRRIISSGEPPSVRLGNFSDDTGPARLSYVGNGAGEQVARCWARAPARCVDGAPDCATSCRQKSPAPLYLQRFCVLGYWCGTALPSSAPGNVARRKTNR